MASDLPNRAFSGDVDLGEELRDKLGLEAGESLGVLHAGARLVVLERTGGSSATAIPWDRDLVLSADVQSFPMADVLSWLHAAGKSGFLHFSFEGQEKSVYLQRGEVVFANSNQCGDRLGDCLLRGNMITLEQLRQTEKRWSRTERFGKALVEQGILTPRELWNGVKFQVEEVVRSLFSFTAGTVCFWDGEVEPDNVVRLALPTTRLIEEGIERRDALLKFLAQLEDPLLRLRRKEELDGTLSGNTRLVFDALHDADSFSTLRHLVGLDPLTVARTVQLLQIVGAVELERAESDDEWLVDPDSCSADDDAVRSLVTGYMNLLAELLSPIIAVEGAKPVAERLRQLIDDLAEAQPELLQGVEIGPAALPDLDELVTRALGIPGQREAIVANSLGELVSYAEFELKNHPRIDEPDRFLDAVEPIRALIGR